VHPAATQWGMGVYSPGEAGQGHPRTFGKNRLLKGVFLLPSPFTEICRVVIS
jgi:hypothetical protein